MSISNSGNASCSNCSTNCLTCTDYSFCLSCPQDKVLINKKCECLSFQFLTSDNICTNCDSSCLTCFDSFFYSCSSCFSSYLLNNVCLNICPIGYYSADNYCIAKGPLTIMSFVFTNISGTYNDSVYNIPARLGFSLWSYPNLNENDPIPAYQRGLYFNAKSLLSFPNPMTNYLLLAVQFYIEF